MRFTSADYRPPWAAVLFLALAACGGDPSESTMKSVIQERIGSQPVCWSLENNRIAWPVRVAPSFVSNIRADPIISAMSRSGYLTVTQSGGGLTSLPVDVVSPTAEAQKWWTDKGFCVGRRVVSKIVEWQKPTTDANVVQVRYSWKLDDVPTWAQRPEFAGIEGIKGDVQGVQVLQKTSNGWK